MLRLRSCALAAAAAASASASSYSSSAAEPPLRPYVRVMRAVGAQGTGLLAAAETFAEFEAFYRAQTQGSETPAAASAARPLTRFCQRPEEVEPFTIVMLKVLCDLQRLEEMRFLFTQCVLELDARPPSVELFHVYLLAISMTDTFNRNEVENVVELLRSCGAAPDVVTRLSLFILYVRLGEDSADAWWPQIRGEIEAALADGSAAAHPLLGLRVQHCFQTLARLHHDAAMTHECFRLCCRLRPAHLTPAVVLPYALLTIANRAAPPFMAAEALEVLRRAEGDAGAPYLSHEVTVFRLLAKCAVWADAAAAAHARAYVAGHLRRRHRIVSEANEATAALLHLETLSARALWPEVLALVESPELPPAALAPAGRPRLLLQGRRVPLLSSDPIDNAAQRLARDGLAGALAALRARRAAGLPVTAASLDLLLLACAYLAPAAAHATARALRREAEAAWGVAPSARSFAYELRACAATAAGRAGGCGDAGAALRESRAALAARGLPLDDPAWLREALELSLVAGDAGAATRALEEHAAAGRPVALKQGTRALRMLARLNDGDGTRRALAALRAAKSPIDQRTLTRCLASLRRAGVSVPE